MLNPQHLLEEFGLIMELTLLSATNPSILQDFIDIIHCT